VWVASVKVEGESSVKLKISIARHRNSNPPQRLEKPNTNPNNDVTQ
jgi:hypothetical protein